MASPTQWTWVRVSSRSWWWTGKPGVLQSMGVTRSDMTEWLNWTEEFPWAQSNSLVKFQVYIHLWGVEDLGSFLVSYFSMWNCYMTPLWSSLEGALFWGESENVTSSFWSSLGHPCPQFFPIPPPLSSTSQHLSSPLPLRPTSFWSPAHWFPQGLIPPNLGHSPKLTHYPGEVSLSCQDQESW